MNKRKLIAVLGLGIPLAVLFVGLRFTGVYESARSYAANSIITKGLIGEQDLSRYDGVNNTFTRTSSTNGVITLNRIGSEVDVLIVYGGGVLRTDVSIQSAITAIGSVTACLLLHPGLWGINNDLTIPSNITLHVPPGAMLVIATGKVLTISGPVIAGAYRIFTYSGAGSSAVVSLYPQDQKWWNNAQRFDSSDLLALQGTVNGAFTVGGNTVINGAANVVGNITVGNFTTLRGIAVGGNAVVNGALNAGNVTVTGLTILETSSLYNEKGLYWLDGTNTAKQMMRLTAANALIIGQELGANKLYLVINGAPNLVSIGAVNTGGEGYRAVVIAN